MQAIKKGAFPPKRKDAVVLPQYCTGNRGACQAGAVRGPLPVTGRGACPRRDPWPGGPRKSLRKLRDFKGGHPINLANPTPWSPLPPCSGLASTHPLPPPVRIVKIESVPSRYGRGRPIYNLIPKGGVSPPLTTPLKDSPLSHDYVVPALPEGEPSLASPLGGGVIAASDDGEGRPKISGFTKGAQPPLELDYIKPSPSRTEKVEIIALYPYGRGQGVGSAKLAHTGRRDQGVGNTRAEQSGRRDGSFL